MPGETGMANGLRPTTTPTQLARAAHEGVLCILLDAVEALAEAGVEVGAEAGAAELRLVGGGARSVAYPRILADLHQGPVRVPDDDEAPATGAAVQAAAVAAGTTIDEVVDRWGLREGGTITEPDPDLAAAAAETRARYRSVAGAAADLA